MLEVYIDARCKTSSDVLMRTCAARRLGVSSDGIEILRGAHGKPYINGVFLNVSHSGDYIVCATASAPIGVDIERIRPVRAGIAERFFHPHEAEYLRSSDASQFFRVWTMKEAYLKRDGRGLSGGLSSFDVLSLPNSIFFTTQLDGGYILTLCTDDPDLSKIHWSVNHNG
ncbi:MAG: 4'-phosphopantetheinyl transferase superfamily protein [Clostridia bacterium]